MSLTIDNNSVTARLVEQPDVIFFQHTITRCSPPRLPLLISQPDAGLPSLRWMRRTGASSNTSVCLTSVSHAQTPHTRAVRVKTTGQHICYAFLCKSPEQVMSMPRLPCVADGPCRALR